MKLFLERNSIKVSNVHSMEINFSVWTRSSLNDVSSFDRRIRI